MPDAPTTTAADAIDWSMTTAQKIGAGVGAAIGASTFAQGVSAPIGAAFVPAYTVACAAIPRMRGIVRYRRTRWFVAHEVAMAVIAGGWAIQGEVPAAVFNGAWGVSAAVWWLVGGED